VVVVLALGTALGVPRLKSWLPQSRSRLEGLQTATVRRTDLDVTLITSGRLESEQRTQIECELQRLDVSVKGQPLGGGGASTIISVVPDGTTVKKGEVICEFDASEYVEMLRQQTMTVERYRTEWRMAELDLDVARMAVKEFKEGTLVEALKELEGVIALGEAGLERSRDRLKWTQRMLEKGYFAASQLSTEEFNDRKAAFQLQKSRTELDVFKRYTAPRVLKALEGKVFGAEAILNYQENRLKRHIDRQQMLEKQVEKCTIRAPHDGLLIYVYDYERQVRIEEGMAVRQGQNLFYLPDLTQMQALAMVHESVASRVRPGMRAKVRLEALPDQELAGEVKSVAQLATRNSFNEVSYFYTVVELDRIPEGLKPGMSAEIEIATDLCHDVLAVPVEAMGYADGHGVCYVAQGENLERREVKVGRATRGELEVVDGLKEGERIVLNPVEFDTELESLSPFNEPDGSARTAAAVAE